MIKTKAIFIIYTKDQKAASQFYTDLLEINPTLDVPGMTEFELSESIKLGIMPAAGIKRILDDKIDEPNCDLSNVKCELYLYVDQPEAYYNKAIALGAIGISHLQNRNWGDVVAYCIDLDGNLLGFAKQIV